MTDLRQLIYNNGILVDGDAEWLKHLEETHLASLKRSEATALDHYLSQLLETVAAE